MPSRFLPAPRLPALATLCLAAAAQAAPTWITSGDNARAVIHRVTPAAHALSSTEVSAQVPRVKEGAHAVEIDSEPLETRGHTLQFARLVLAGAVEPAGGGAARTQPAAPGKT